MHWKIGFHFTLYYEQQRFLFILLFFAEQLSLYSSRCFVSVFYRLSARLFHSFTVYCINHYTNISFVSHRNIEGRPTVNITEVIDLTSYRTFQKWFVDCLWLNQKYKMLYRNIIFFNWRFCCYCAWRSIRY